MLCQKCHKNLATVRYAEVVDGKVSDLHLCQECLAVRQETPGAGFELSGPVPASKAAKTVPAERTRPKAPRSCPTCGTSVARVLDSGRVGCSECYRLFADDIEPILVGLHGDVVHSGKTPRMDDARVRLHADLQTKRTLLRSAIQAESYEEAASLRDDIRQLETILGATLAARE